MAMGRRHIISVPLIVMSALAMSSTSAEARVAPITLKELIDSSDLIVVACETKVEDAPAGLDLGDDVRVPIKIATARIVEIWKGYAGPEVRYIASPTWTCDTSYARAGERVVLFLSKFNSVPFMIIGHSGRGRMEIRDVNATPHATIWLNDVRLPWGFTTTPGPETKYESIRSIKLSQLRWTVGAMRRTDILLAGAIGTFALAGLSCFLSSRRHIKPVDAYEEIHDLDDSIPRDISPKDCLRSLAKVAFFVATILALTVLWCNA